MSTREVLDAVKASVKVNATVIDKVVIVLSGRVEKGHEDSIKDVMKWLKLHQFSENISLLYTKCEDMTPSEKYDEIVGKHIFQTIRTYQSLYFIRPLRSVQHPT